MLSFCKCLSQWCSRRQQTGQGSIGGHKVNWPVPKQISKLPQVLQTLQVHTQLHPHVSPKMLKFNRRL